MSAMLFNAQSIGYSTVKNSISEDQLLALSARKKYFFYYWKKTSFGQTFSDWIKKFL